MSAFVLRSMGYADGSVSAMVGMYLAAYDPDGRDGLGEISWTPIPSEAMCFDSAAAALRCYHAQSTVRPLRDWDLRPNRPLTAHHAVLEEYPS